MKLTFRQIEAFRAVIDTGSVTEAAAVLGVSQPAASRLIGDFEAQVGFALFQRVGRNLRPTAEARLLADEVRRAFDGLDRVSEAAAAIRDFRGARLTLVATPAFASRIVPELVAAFVRRNPGVAVTLDVQATDATVEWVADERFDFGFTEIRVGHPAMAVRPLTETEAVCLVPAGHRLADRDSIGPQDLAGETFVSYRVDARFRQVVDAVFEQAGVQRNLRHEARTTEAVVRLVEHGLGVAVLGIPRPADVASPRCRVIRFEPAIAFGAQMIWPRHRLMSAVAQDFLAMVEAEFAPQRRPQAAAPAFAAGG
jgi:DNA-binding transcriptional LysR family regulator